MATIRKRTSSKGDTSYHVQVRIKGHPPETATFEKLQDAKAWAAKIETDIKAGRHFGESKRHTFGELLAEYEKHAASKLRSFADRKPHLSRWEKEFGDCLLKDITPQRIKAVRDKLTQEATRHTSKKSGNAEQDALRQMGTRSGASANRYLASLSACLSYGVKELAWLEKNPCDRVSRNEEAAGRVRFLSDDERTRLLEACRQHADLYLAVVLSLVTGARQSEVMTLKWGQIDFTRKIITLHETKNGERRALPLVSEAFTLLHARAKVRNIQDDRVFPPTTKDGKVRSLREAWERALELAEIDNFHWHDLRHTAASYLVMSGVSLVEVAKILGHRTLAMVARYAHLSDDHIVSTGEKLAARMGI